MDGTVVVVDDEPELLDIICQVLDDEGFHVICLERPARAIEAEADLHPCLYLLDLMLPGMSGIELAQQIKSSGEAKTPMIAMSASSDMLRRAKASGLFEDVLAKPFDIVDLVNRVEWHAV